MEERKRELLNTPHHSLKDTDWKKSSVNYDSDSDSSDTSGDEESDKSATYSIKTPIPVDPLGQTLQTEPSPTLIPETSTPTSAPVSEKRNDGQTGINQSAKDDHPEEEEEGGSSPVTVFKKLTLSDSSNKPGLCLDTDSDPSGSEQEDPTSELNDDDWPYASPNGLSLSESIILDEEEPKTISIIEPSGFEPVPSTNNNNDSVTKVTIDSDPNKKDPDTVPTSITPLNPTTAPSTSTLLATAAVPEKLVTEKKQGHTESETRTSYQDNIGQGGNRLASTSQVFQKFNMVASLESDDSDTSTSDDEFPETTNVEAMYQKFRNNSVTAGQSGQELPKTRSVVAQAGGSSRPIISETCVEELDIGCGSSSASSNSSTISALSSSVANQSVKLSSGQMPSALALVKTKIFAPHGSEKNSNFSKHQIQYTQPGQDQAGPDSAAPNGTPTNTDRQLEIVKQASQLVTTALLDIVQHLTVRDLVTKNWDSFANEIKPRTMQSLSKTCWFPDSPICVETNPDLNQEFESAKSRLWTCYDFLKHLIVNVLEAHFDANICLPEEELETFLRQTSQSARHRMPDKILDENMRQLLNNKINEFVIEYRARNEEITHKEEKMAATILDAVVDTHYANQMDLFMGAEYHDPKSLERHHDRIYSDSREIFGKACAFKNPFFTKKYDTILQDKILKIWEEFKKWNDNRQFIVKDQLAHLMNSSRDIYRQKIEEHPDLTTKESLRLLHEEARTEVHSHWTIATKSSPPSILPGMTARLEDFMKNNYQKKIASFTFKKNTKEMRTLTSGQLEKMADGMIDLHVVQGDRAAPALTTEGHLQPSVARMEVPKNLAGNSTTPPPIKPRTRRTLLMRSQNPRNQLDDLPKTSVAFHVGLGRTKMGLMDDEGNFCLLEDVENILYFQTPQLLKGKGDEFKNFGPATSFVNLLVTDRLDREHKVKVSTGRNQRQESHTFRVDELISFMLAALKWRAEMELGQLITYSLIVVPQSLNTSQRDVVRNAAMFAGFHHFDLINDTSAMTLSYVMTNRPTSNHLIACNMSEGFLDVARFNLNNGFIQPEAVTGDHFIPTSNATSWSFGGVVIKMTGVPVNGAGGSGGGGGGNDLAQRASKIFSPEQLKYFSNTPVPVIMASVSSKNFQRLAPHTNKYGRTILLQEPHEHLKGASYLLGIQKLDCDDPIWKKWRPNVVVPTNMDQDDDDALMETFKQKLLTDNTGGSQMSSNVSIGQGLTPQQFEQKKQNYFLTPMEHFHNEKMQLIQLQGHIQKRLHQMDSSRAARVTKLSQLNQICKNIRRPQFTKDGLHTTWATLRTNFGTLMP